VLCSQILKDASSKKIHVGIHIRGFCVECGTGESNSDANSLGYETQAYWFSGFQFSLHTGGWMWFQVVSQEKKQDAQGRARVGRRLFPGFENSKFLFFRKDLDVDEQSNRILLQIF
jgi:hypothetical protein